MKNFRKLIITIIVFTLFSCKNEQTLIETKNYKIEFEKAAFFHADYTNSISKNPLDINAERISLKEIVALLTDSDVRNISFENSDIQNFNFKLLIKQKVNNEENQKVILEVFLESLNLKILEKKSKINSFKVFIKDSIKFNNFRINDAIKSSETISNSDSIKLKKSSLKNLIEIINSQYDKDFSIHAEKGDFNYKWKRTSFNKLKIQLENDLGLSFEKSTNVKKEYIIQN